MSALSTNVCGLCITHFLCSSFRRKPGSCFLFALIPHTLDSGLHRNDEKNA